MLRFYLLRRGELLLREIAESRSRGKYTLHVHVAGRVDVRHS